MAYGHGMGFRFRRSVRIIPGIRLNFSKSGISTSIGGRGATINFSKRGTRTTVGIPGTGLSYSEMVPKADGSPHQAQMPNGDQASNQANGCLALLVIGLVIALAISIKGIVSSNQTYPQAGSVTPAVESRRVTAKYLNCRLKPDQHSKRASRLVRGDTVTLIPTDQNAESTTSQFGQPNTVNTQIAVQGTDGQWVQVSVDGGRCWVLKTYLDDN